MDESEVNVCAEEERNKEQKKNKTKIIKANIF